MDDLFAPVTLYRATGVILCKLSAAYYGQLDLFGEVIRLQRLSNLYEGGAAPRSPHGTRCGRDACYVGKACDGQV